MKEKLYTIPLNDAMNAEDECPFCFIERNVEQDIMDYVLGSCASYMESDTREATDKAGFCRMHYKKMFDYGNTLGNGWILKTHYKKLIAEMKDHVFSFYPGKTSLMDKLKGKPSEPTLSLPGLRRRKKPAISVIFSPRNTPAIWIPFSICIKMMRLSAKN